MNLTTTHVLRTEAQSLECRSLDEQLKAFWELESLGIQEAEKTLYDDFAAHVTFHDGRYQVLLPWKYFHEPLPDNYSLSVKRLRGLLCRLRQDPDILKEYDRIISDQLQKGNTEAVPEEETRPAQVHYLPHHAVVRKDKATTKLRVVYDASAKCDGPSLNECLYKGPKFNQLIFDLLLRFRSYRVALTADVEKAFLVIAVDNKDRDVLRFIWVDDVIRNDPKLRIYRLKRVVFGVSSSPFLLNATVKFHLESFMRSHKVVVERLLQSTYVNDIVSGADSEDEAFELYAQSKELFRRGRFKLRKFLTSSKQLQQRMVADLSEGGPISVSRSYFHSVKGPVTLTLCGFSDASTRAYAAVLFLNKFWCFCQIHCFEDSSCIPTAPDNTKIGIAICSSFLKADCFCAL